MPSGKYAPGVRFGRLTLWSIVGRDKSRNNVWECECDCGQTAQVPTSSLGAGKTNSCGCLNSELTAQRNGSHGMTGTSEYYAYNNMMNRCYNTADKRYSDYGGRGIRVCERWRHSFDNFLADMGLKPAPDLSIDRINNDGDYAPDNCRWATALEQRANRRPMTHETHCRKRKHLFTPETTAILSSGRRTCILCRREAAKANYHRKKTQS